MMRYTYNPRILQRSSFATRIAIRACGSSKHRHVRVAPRNGAQLDHYVSLANYHSARMRPNMRKMVAPTKTTIIIIAAAIHYIVCVARGAINNVTHDDTSTGRQPTSAIVGSQVSRVNASYHINLGTFISN